MDGRPALPLEKPVYFHMATKHSQDIGCFVLRQNESSAEANLNRALGLGVMEGWMVPKGPLGLPRLCFLAIWSWTCWKRRFLSAGREYKKENKQNGETAGVWMPEFLLNSVQGDLTCSPLFPQSRDKWMLPCHMARLGTPAHFLKIHGDFSLCSWTWHTDIERDNLVFTSLLSQLSLSTL